MNGEIYPISINYAKDNNLYFSDKKKYNNEEFNLQKYQRFKSKDNKSYFKIKTLKGAENKVKHLLSNFLKNYEKEENLDAFDELEKSKKTIEISLNESNNDNKKLKKDKASLIKNIKNKNPNNNASNKNFNQCQKKKVKFDINSINSKKNFLNKGDNLKRTKTYAKFEKKEKSNSMHQNKTSKNLNFMDSNSLIQKDSYINFKNDNIMLNKNQNNKAIILKTVNKMGNIQKRNKNKKLLNDSEPSSFLSLLSDFSDNNIIKKSFDNKMNNNNDELFKKENIKSNYPNKNRQFDEKGLTTLINPKQIINKILSPKKLTNIKIVSNNNKDTKNIIKRGKTTNTENNNISNNFKYDKHMKILKDNVKKSLILFPKELSINKHKNTYNYHLKKLQKSLILTSDINYNNKTNVIKNDLNQDLQEKTNKSILKKTKINNDTNKLQDNNLENKNVVKFIGSSKLSLQDYSIYYKGKGEFYIRKYRVLTHKPKVYDSLDDEEYEDEEEIKSLYLDPNSYFTIIFDLILFIFNIISLFESPFYLAINNNFCKYKHITLNFVINIIIELLNILDLFFGFFRAYYNWEEKLIQKKINISLKYVTGWFIFDLLSSIPVFTINKILEPQCQINELNLNYLKTNLGNLHYLLILNRILKVFKIFWYNQAWKIISNKLNDYGRITIYFILFLATINYTVCIHIFLGRNSYPNWISITKLDTEPFIHIYICSIYAITMAITTVGYGDITCYSFSEIIFQLFLLIIGIIAYTFLVSFLSNYIQKINEQSVDFEKKKSILDEIRTNNPNMPYFLYVRILKFLRHKIVYEKKLNNIIFDCLPIGLKNNLITEMYKPIIDNFIFFKYFQNTDFNVRVVLAFKPIIAYKNDILVNEGYMIEEIMFVKKGILSVELPINLINPKENFKKYLNKSSLIIDKGSNIQTLGDTIIINGDDKKKNDFVKSDLNKNSSFLKLPTFMNCKTEFNKKLTYDERKRKEREEIELERKKNLTYVKIIGIRENEHFGDVLMFLEQKSPLRVRVRSIKCELLFLKKIDAFSISANYPNIWKNIHKKSIFNYGQLKKSIKKIVEIYCSVKTIQSNNQNLYIDKINRNQKHKMIYKNKSDSNIFSFKEIKKDLRYCKTFNIPKIKYSIFFKNKNDLFIENNNNKRYSLSERKCLSSSLFKRKNKNNNPKIFDKINNIKYHSSKNYKQFGKKSLDVFNGKSKYCKRTNQNNKDNINNSKIIIKETEQDNIEEKFHNNKKKEIINEKLSNKNKKNSNSYNFSIDNNEKENIFYDKEINNELFDGEVVNVNNGENLLNKKIIFDYISTKQSDFNNNNINFKNNKLKLLLSFCEDENENKIQNEKKQNKKNNVNKNKKTNENNYLPLNKIKKINSDNNDYNNNNNDLSKNSESTINDNNKLKWDNNFLSINNNISFRVDSSYNNFNLISENKLIKNKLLQNKLTIFLLDEIQNIYKKKDYYNSTTNSNILKTIKKRNSLADSIKYNNKKYSLINPAKKSNSLSKMHKINKYDNNRKHSLYYNLFVTDSLKKTLNQSSLYNNNNQSNKIGKINIMTSLIDNDIDDTISNKRREKERINQNEKINNINNSIIDIQKKTKRNSEKIRPFIRNKKKENNLLSKINFNIQKTNQNLNNPDEFYYNYFNSILGKGNKSNKKRNTMFFSQQTNDLFKI